MINAIWNRATLVARSVGAMQLEKCLPAWEPRGKPSDLLACCIDLVRICFISGDRPIIML